MVRIAGGWGAQIPRRRSGWREGNEHGPRRGGIGRSDPSTALGMTDKAIEDAENNRTYRASRPATGSTSRTALRIRRPVGEGVGVGGSELGEFEAELIASAGEHRGEQFGEFF